MLHMILPWSLPPLHAPTGCSGRLVRATATARVVELRRGTRRLNLEIPRRKDDIQNLYVTYFQPAVVVHPIKDGNLVLALTEDVQSGVFGYKRARFFRVAWKKKTLKELGSLEYSDFGSWCFVGRGRIRWWDAYWSVGPHQGSHRYKVCECGLWPKLHPISVGYTKRSYNPDYQVEGGDPRHVSAKNDPLREFGLRWKWWGE